MVHLIVLLLGAVTEAEAVDSDMRIVTLIENTTGVPGLYSEHGLSLYLEIGERKILFDAGQSGLFAENAEKLGVDLSAVDTAVLSHGHYDHGNGFARFFELNRNALVYAGSGIFGEHRNVAGRDIGLSRDLVDHSRFCCVEDSIDLGDGITFLSASGKDCPYPADPYGLQMRQGERLVPEDFSHERYLLIQESGVRVCITGCAHRGVLNILHWFDPDVLIGGFHFKPLSPDSDCLRMAACKMAQKPRRYYTGHCTGEAQYALLKRVLGHQLNPISTGMIIEV